MEAEYITTKLTVISVYINNTDSKDMNERKLMEQ